MLALSHFLHFTVQLPAAASGPGHATWRLVDALVQLGDVDYPEVTHLLVRPNGTVVALPWKWVSAIDVPARALRLRAVPNEADLHPVDALPADAVRIGRDVLDALILDLQRRHVTRANDVWLEPAEGALRLRAADTSWRALLRRLVNASGGDAAPSGHTDWKYVEFLRGAPEAVHAGAGYHRRIVHLPPGEIAGLAQAMPYLHVAELLALLPVQHAADVLERLGPERRLQTFEELPEPYAAECLAAMAPDVAADLLGVVETGLARRLLRRLPPESSEPLIDLLRYPDDTVGGMMTNDVVAAPANLTAVEARAALKPKLSKPDFVYFIYVLDSDAPDAPLRGVLSLRDLVVADDDTQLCDLMNPYLITFTPLEPARAAAYRLLASQLAAVPVIGPERQLLGAVTVDMAAAEVAPRGLTTPRVFA